MNQAPKQLELKEVSVVRAGSRVLDRVSVELRRGEIVAIIGPNGAGKSTLLEAAIGAAPLATGAVLIDGRPARGLHDRACAISFLTGEAEPPHEASVATLLEEAQRVTDDSWLRELESRLGLTALRNARAGMLSRGERRRVLLYEALASAKPFLLLDEPTGVFDPLQLLDAVTLFRMASARGAGLLVSVHQMSDAEAFGARLVLLNRGRVVASGDLDALRRMTGLDSTATLQDLFLALLRQPTSEEDAHAQA
jgi:ABC-type multidrug transport system ATPase subunit